MFQVFGVFFYLLLWTVNTHVTSSAYCGLFIISQNKEVSHLQLLKDLVFFFFFFCLLFFYSKNYLPEHLFKSRTAVHLALIVKDKNIHTHKFFCTTLHHFPFFSHLLRFIFIMDQFFLVFFFCLVVCYLSLWCQFCINYFFFFSLQITF